MPGTLDKTLAAVAKTVVSDLGAGLNVDISFLKQSGGTYNVATGTFDSTQTSYFFKAPIEFIDAEEEEGREEQAARIYIAPDQIGGSYPDLDDQIVLFDVEEFLGTQAGLTLKTQSNDNLMIDPLSGSGDNCQITGIRLYGGGQEYLYVVQVRF
jgi:hypothetical protein